MIAVSTHLEGRLSGPGDVRIEGQLKGTVDVQGHVLVTEKGTIEAKLHGREVVIAGAVDGNVTADEKIELKASAQLRGNITAPRILIQEGASFEGQVFMRSPDRKKPAEPKQSGEVADKADEERDDRSPSGSDSRPERGSDRGKHRRNR